MRSPALLAATLTAALLATAVSAQDAPTPPSPQAMHARMAEMASQAGDDIALLVGLRPDQRPGLDALLAALRPQPGAWRGGMHGGAEGRDGGMDQTLGQRLDAMAATVDAKDAEAKQRIADARRFYASLSPDQRARFDALDRLRRDDRMARMMMMHDRRGRPGGDRGGPMAPPQG